MDVNDIKNHKKTEQIMTFLDGSPSWSVGESAHKMPASTTFDPSSSELSNFFSRPIRILEKTWAVGSTVYAHVNPWEIFWNDVNVKNKISGYSLLRCNMHISVKVSGGPFYYGRAMLSYKPFLSFDANESLENPLDNIMRSQRPHIFINPTDSSGGDMVLPFFFPENYITVPTGDFEDMGVLTLQTLNPLQTTNGGDDSIVIQVYAWATDVEIGMPTSSVTLVKSTDYEKQAGLQDMMNKVKDSFRSRPTESPTTPFVKPSYGGNLVHADHSDTCTKMSLMSDQNIISDSTVVGLDGKDELNIVSLAKRESYLTSFTWSNTKTPQDVLFLLNVSPMMYDTSYSTSTPADQIRFAMTPSAFVSQLFKLWHGTMEIRLQFVASDFHRGRVKVVYDPINLHSLNTKSHSDNANYSVVVDLAETRDVTIRVPWGQSTHWMNLPEIQPALIGDKPFSTTYPHWPINGCNGQIGVFVVNDLISPSTKSTDEGISVNVFTKMTDDFCLADPSTSSLSGVTYCPLLPTTKEAESDEYVKQSGLEDTSPQADAPMTQTVTDIGGVEMTNPSHFSDIYPGERIVSVRDLLKRYCYHTTYHNKTAGSGTLKILQSVFPYYRGSSPGSKVGTTSTGKGWNYCNTTFLNYIVPAFGGYRGSIRWKVYVSSNSMTSMQQMTAVRCVNIANGGLFQNTYNVLDWLASPSSAAFNANKCFNPATSSSNLPISSSGDGLVITRADIAPLEVEFPWYSKYRYFRGCDYRKVFINADRGMMWLTTIGCANTSITVNGTATATNTNSGAQFYCAAGDDFNVFFFQGVPPMYFQSDPTPSTTT